MRSFFAEATFDPETGETLHLVCDFYTIQVVEGITGQSWDEILPEMVSPSQSLFITVLYGLLRKRHRDITIHEAAAVLYDVKDRAALAAVMGAVIAKACNFDSGEEEEKPAKKKRGGRSPASAMSG